MSRFFLPEGASLTVQGPMIVEIVPQGVPSPAPQGVPGYYATSQGYAPVPVPQMVPQAVPQPVPQATPYLVPQAVPQSVPGYIATSQGYAPAYQSPEPMPQAPMQVPDRVPTPIAQSAPGLDPAVQQMADYLEARARDEMRKEYEQQAAAVVEQVGKQSKEKEGVA